MTLGRDRSKGINVILHQHQYGTAVRIVAAVAKFQQKRTSDAKIYNTESY